MPEFGMFKVSIVIFLYILISQNMFNIPDYVWVPKNQMIWGTFEVYCFTIMSLSMGIHYSILGYSIYRYPIVLFIL